MKNLITFDEAVKKAKGFYDKYNECEEFADAWYFYVNDGNTYIGGIQSGVIVEKSGGKVLGWAEYFMDSNRKVIETGNIIKV